MVAYLVAEMVAVMDSMSVGRMDPQKVVLMVDQWAERKILQKVHTKVVLWGNRGAGKTVEMKDI